MHEGIPHEIVKESRSKEVGEYLKYLGVLKTKEPPDKIKNKIEQLVETRENIMAEQAMKEFKTGRRTDEEITSGANDI